MVFGPRETKSIRSMIASRRSSGTNARIAFPIAVQ